MAKLQLAIRHILTKDRSVLINDDLTLTINDNLGEQFRGEVFGTRSGDGAGPDNSPRSGPRSKVWTFAQVLNPGDRFLGQDADRYEVVTKPIPRRAANQALCYEVEAIPVVKLYPIVATLSDLGGVEVEDDLPLAIWEGTESNASHGEYDTLQAEAPPEFYNVLRIVNRELVVGSRPFRILTSLLHAESPHVRMSVRSPDG